MYSKKPEVLNPIYAFMHKLILKVSCTIVAYKIFKYFLFPKKIISGQMICMNSQVFFSVKTKKERNAVMISFLSIKTSLSPCI